MLAPLSGMYSPAAGPSPSTRRRCVLSWLKSHRGRLGIALRLVTPSLDLITPPLLLTLGLPIFSVPILSITIGTLGRRGLALWGDVGWHFGETNLALWGDAGGTLGRRIGKIFR